MEMNFREYAEAWGTLAGAAGGAVLGGWPGAIAGGALGYGAEKLWDTWKNRPRNYKMDQKYMVYYRDLPDQENPTGRIVKELMPNAYVDIGRKYELWNANLADDGKTYEPHPYFYYGKTDEKGNLIKIVPRIKAGYRQYQRQTRQGYGQRRGYNQGQQRGYPQQGYGQQRYR